MTALMSGRARPDGLVIELGDPGQPPRMCAENMMAVANVVTFPTAGDADPQQEQARGNLVSRWRACCAALFAIGVPPVEAVDEQTMFDATVMPLLWPPY
jgi:hypothetical protein